MKRGRKSAADLRVIVGNFGRPHDSPPSELTPKQADIWRSVIATEVRGLFGSAVLRGMLADYCRLRESADKLSEIIGSYDAETIKTGEGTSRYNTLIRMRELETRAATSLATKLRLTNQSRYTPQAAGTAAKNSTVEKRPWED